MNDAERLIKTWERREEKHYSVRFFALKLDRNVRVVTTRPPLVKVYYFTDGSIVRTTGQGSIFTIEIM
jgi:hypothetical protein